MRHTIPLLLLLAAPASAAELPEYPLPAATTSDEPVATAYSPAKAAAYLDGVGVNWTRERHCVTCHTNLPYLMARPLLKGDDAGWKEVRRFLEEDVAERAAGEPDRGDTHVVADRSGSQPVGVRVRARGDAYVVATAAGLAFTDAPTGKLSDSTKRAFDRMWAAQKKTGEWNWIKCAWPPMEHDDYYGATLAAVAVAVAPGKYAASEAAKPGLAKLRAYFAATPPPDLHHKAMLLWASATVPGLMTADGQAAAVAELRAKQRADGGWNLPSLGTYVRRDKTANDPAAASDGYATGLAVFVLRQAGVAAGDPAVAGGARWLKANQRASGRWFTRSLNNDKAHYVTNAGTAFAVLALAACGEPVAAAVGK